MVDFGLVGGLEREAVHFENLEHIAIFGADGFIIDMPGIGQEICKRGFFGRFRSVSSPLDRCVSHGRFISLTFTGYSYWLSKNFDS